MNIATKINKILRRAILFTIAGILAVTNFFPGEKAYAANCSQDFYAQNDILYYDACAVACGTSSSSSGTPGKVTELKGSNNAEKIYNFFISAGLNEAQSAGIISNIYHESGFSPFRQEMSQGWPNGGWGIAQFTGLQTGWQRDLATKFVKKEVGDDLFNEYYSPDYAGPTTIDTGYAPENVPQDVNDKFLLAQLNYLLEYTSTSTEMNLSGWIRGDRVEPMFAAFPDIPKPSNYDISVFDYMKTLQTPEHAAIVWAILYEAPANKLARGKERAESVKNVMEYIKGGGESSSVTRTSGAGTNCSSKSGGDGSLKAGGMTLEEAEEFMKIYRESPDSTDYITPGAQVCSELDMNGRQIGPVLPLANCVAFSQYFLTKYTDLKELHLTPLGNGNDVVGQAAAKTGLEVSKEPRPYSVFSYGGQGGIYSAQGHTGIVLGVDTERQVMITGEASCGRGMDMVRAFEHPLSDIETVGYTFLHLEDNLTGDIK